MIKPGDQVYVLLGHGVDGSWCTLTGRLPRGSGYWPTWTPAAMSSGLCGPRHDGAHGLGSADMTFALATR